MTQQEPSKPAIGFIGMGHMGSHMASRLIQAGYPLTVYDRTREKAQAIAGATVAETPKEAAAHSEVVISIVTDDAALEEVMFDTNGVLAGTRAGSVIIDMSTVSPHASRRLFQKARAKGVAMLDAAVSGSVPQVEQGSLLIFVNPAGPPREQARQGRSDVRTAAIIGLILLLLVVFVIGGFAGWVYAGTRSSSSASPSNATTLQSQMESVAAKVKPSIVEVYVTLPNNEAAIGSGVIVDSRGYMVTNNHVVSGELSIQVILSNGTKEVAQLAGADPNYDLAVLKIAVPQGGLTVATLGNSAQLQVGQQVLVIGNPLGITQTVTNGIVSALKRSVSEGQGAPTIQNAIQTDAPINPGNSGGALVDLQGNVVGIPTLTAIDPEFNTPANGVGFAIPINRVKSILPQIIQQG